MNFGIASCCFLEALGAAFLVFWALETDLKIEGFFWVVTHPEFGIWRRDQRLIWTLKADNSG